MHVINDWKKSLDSDGQWEDVLTDLFMAFDCIDHELVIAKLYANGFNKNFSGFILSYLIQRK